MKQSASYNFVKLYLIVMISLFAISTTYAAQQDSLFVPYKKALEGKKVIFVVTQMTLPLTKGWNDVFKDEFSRLGMQYKVYDANWNTQTATQAMESSIVEKPDVIILHNFNVGLHAKQIKRAQKAGIFVISINMKSLYDADVFVGANYTNLGKLTAEAVVDNAKKTNRNKVAILQGDVSAADSYFQMQGFNEVMAKNPQIEVVSNQAAGWMADKADSIMSTVLKQHPDLGAVYAMWIDMGLGAASAIKKAGLENKVALFTNSGSERYACDAVKKGLISKYWGYDVPRQAGDIVTAVKLLLQSKITPGSEKIAIYSPFTVMSPDNVNPCMCFDVED